MNGTMSRRRPIVTSLSVLLSCIAASAAPDWTKVKAGMNGDETLKLLGQPLVRTAARGYDVWIYDGRGEIVFAGGPVKSWSIGAPTTESLVRPVARDVLLRPARRSVTTRLAPTPALPSRTYQEMSTTHFRYLAQ